MSWFLFYCLHVDHYYNKNDGTGFDAVKKSGLLPVLFSSPPCAFCFYSKPHLWHWESRIQCVNSLTLLMMSSLECLIGWNSLTVRPHPTQSRPMCISAHQHKWGNGKVLCSEPPLTLQRQQPQQQQQQTQLEQSMLSLRAAQSPLPLRDRLYRHTGIYTLLLWFHSLYCSFSLFVSFSLALT